MIPFELKASIGILKRTPAVLESMLGGLPNEWVKNNEGGESWSPYDVVGHLIHGEDTDWLARMEIILSGAKDKTFTPFNRFAQFNRSKGKSMDQLLAEFKGKREANINSLKAKNITEKELRMTGIHNEFGMVTLKQLLATWVAHDLSHIGQIVRVMGKQYLQDVGPWQKYLPMLHINS